MRRLTTISKLAIFVLAAGLTFASCDSATSPKRSVDNTEVALRFQATTGSSSSASMMALAAQQDNLVIDGKNGARLTITDIHFIVDDFELEKTDGECEGLKGQKEDDCEEFEKELFLVDLPLDGQPLAITASSIQNGVYSELEFEIDNIDIDDEEDQAENKRKKAFFNDQIKPKYANWPEAASMVIEGSYETKNGETSSFKTFAEAEISIEMPLDPPLEINGNAGKRVTVNINPEKWFTNQDGTVVNLAKYDYNKVKQPLKFEIEMEDGFESVDHD